MPDEAFLGPGGSSPPAGAVRQRMSGADHKEGARLPGFLDVALSPEVDNVGGVGPDTEPGGGHVHGIAVDLKCLGAVVDVHPVSEDAADHRYLRSDQRAEPI